VRRARFWPANLYKTNSSGYVNTRPRSPIRPAARLRARPRLASGPLGAPNGGPTADGRRQKGPKGGRARPHTVCGGHLARLAAALIAMQMGGRHCHFLAGPVKSQAALGRNYCSPRSVKSGTGAAHLARALGQPGELGKTNFQVANWSSSGRLCMAPFRADCVPCAKDRPERDEVRPSASWHSTRGEHWPQLFAPGRIISLPPPPSLPLAPEARQRVGLCRSFPSGCLASL